MHHRAGTSSSDLALAKLGCYSTLTWYVINRWIVNEWLRSDYTVREQFETTVFSLQYIILASCFRSNDYVSLT
jgi:hypothetical protein